MEPTPQQPDEALRRALDAWRPEKARGAFEDELRARFVESEDGALSTALDAYAPEARASFRRRLRERFVGEGQRGPRLVKGGWGVVLAAAAAVMLWVLWPSPAFVVDADVFVAEGLLLDGEPVPAATSASEFASLLEEARLVTTADHPLRFRFRDQFIVELGERTGLELQGLEREGDAWRLAGDGRPGTYRIATGPGFDGAARPLEFRTAVRNVEVVGTVFSVEVLSSDSVCICCNEGNLDTYCASGDGGCEPVAAHQTLLTEPSGLSRREDFEAHQKPLRALAAVRDAW